MAKELLTIENGIKLGGLIIAFVLQYAAIKSDLRDFQTNVRKDKEFTEYRLSELQDCCNDKHNKRIVMNTNQVAIVPNGIEIETER